MSDRVENKLVVTGPLEDLCRFKDKAQGMQLAYVDEKEGIPQPLCLNSLLPVPPRLVARTRWGYVEEKAAGLPHGTYANDPAESGGRWEECNWGCRYGPLECAPAAVESNSLVYHFETRNATLSPALHRISQLWPLLRFQLTWRAEWENYFDTAYLHTFANGKVTAQVADNERIDLPEWDALRAEIESRTSTPSVE